MQASPLQQVIDRFGDKDASDRTEARREAKDALIKAVQAFVTKGDLLDDDFSEGGLERLSNKKLLKLLDVAEKVEADFGSRDALIDKLLELEGRTKDAGYREHLEKDRLPALFARYETLARKAD